MSKEEQDAWIKAGKPSLDEWSNSTIRKMVVNRRSDEEQFERYRFLLGNDAPKTFTSFQRIKYNNEEKWEYLKAFAGYKRRYPTSSKPYFDIYRDIKANTSIKGVVLPPVQKRAYILPTAGRDPYHLLNRMKERGISDDDIRSFMEDAKIMLVQWGGQRQRFVSDRGMCVITKEDDGWLFKTAWTAKDYDEESYYLMEAIKRAGL